MPNSSALRRGLARALVVLLSILSFACARPGAAPGPQTPDKSAAAPAAKATPTGEQVVLPGFGEDSDTTVDLPAFPADADLIELRQGLRPDLGFFVDARSVQVAPNGEIRYTFVVRSTSGARNVTFESMRCPLRERMIIAVGGTGRRWAPARFLRWEAIEVNDTLGQRGTLHREMFCAALLPIASAKEGVAALRAGGHPRLR